MFPRLCLFSLFFLSINSVLVAAPPGRAWAGGQDLANAAHDAQERGDADAAIRLYGEAIAAGDLPAKTVAVLFNNRGLAYWRKRELDKALADYDAALRLRPDYVPAYHGRGITFRDKGMSEREIADYDAALRLLPNDAFAYENRGRARLHVGRIGPALDDLARAVELDPADAYSVLWLHLARSWGRQDDALEFARNLGALDHSRWPAPIMALYAGKTDPVQVRAAAGAAEDSGIRAQHLCEANFYTGALMLLRGVQGEAKQLFEAAAQGCPPYFLEAYAAKAELKRFEP